MIDLSTAWRPFEPEKRFVVADPAGMTNGKWTCSTQEEHWNCGEEFDTREEALSYAMSELVSEYDVDDGANVWVGQIHAITPDELAEHGADAWKVIDNLRDRLYEMVGDEVDYDIEVPKEAEDDLDERLKVAIRDWMIAHKIELNCFTLEHVERHTWERCKETRLCDGFPTDVEQCVLQIEHDGDCEWP